MLAKGPKNVIGYSDPMLTHMIMNYFLTKLKAVFAFSIIYHVIEILAPNHYLNEFWSFVVWTLRKNPWWNFDQNTKISVQDDVFENVACKIAAILSPPKWDNTCVHADIFHLILRSLCMLHCLLHKFPISSSSSSAFNTSIYATPYIQLQWNKAVSNSRCAMQSKMFHPIQLLHVTASHRHWSSCSVDSARTIYALVCMLTLSSTKGHQGTAHRCLIIQSVKQFPQVLIYHCVKRSSDAPAVHCILLTHWGPDKMAAILETF